MKQIIVGLIILFFTSTFCFTQSSMLEEQMQIIAANKNISFTLSQQTVYDDGLELNHFFNYELLDDQQFIDGDEYTVMRTKDAFLFLDHMEKSLMYQGNAKNPSEMVDLYGQFLTIIKELDDQGKVSYVSNGESIEFTVEGMDAIGVESYLLVVNTETQFYDKINIVFKEGQPLRSMSVTIKNLIRISSLSKDLTAFITVNNNQIKATKPYSDYNLNSNGL